MKTTLNLPDELILAVKLKAVRENRTMQDVIAELLRRGLFEDSSAADAGRRRVQLPLVSCVHEALPDQEMTPDRVAQVLADEEAAGAHGPL